MTNKGEKTQSIDPVMNPASPYYLHPTDTGMKIVSNIFTGMGYKGWKRSVSIALSGKNKMGFVDGSIKRSISNGSLAKAWDRVNDVVLGWLLGAVDEKIFKSVLWFKTAKEVWDNLEQRFGQSSSAQLFTVEEQLSKAIQSHDMTVEEFFTKMKGLWDEIDALDPLPTCSCLGCSCDLTQKTIKSQQRRRLIQFLMKLDGKYQHTRSNILMMKELPNVAEAYSILTQEKTHQEFSKAMVIESENQEPSIACRVEKRKFLDNKRGKNDPRSKRQSFYYEHCKIHGHTIDKCWKIHGYPSNIKSNIWRKDEAASSKANAVLTDPVQDKDVDTKLTQEQYQQLLKLLRVFDEEPFASW
ncbi:unnamed protein product [Amaranthus hypochondriacus]